MRKKEVKNKQFIISIVVIVVSIFLFTAIVNTNDKESPTGLFSFKSLFNVKPTACMDYDKDGSCSSLDCNDNNPTIHPGATEICGDGIDQDCDGSDLACRSVVVTGASPVSSNQDIYTVKYDSYGRELWAKNYDSGSGEFGNGVAIDSVGNIIIGGRIDNDMITVKYDPNGNEIWNKRYGGIYFEDISAVVTDSQDNIFVTGRIQTGVPSQGYDYYSIKYDPLGNELWHISYDGGKIESATDVAVDSQDNFIVTGSIGMVYNDQTSDYLTIKYDKRCKYLWEVRYKGPKNDIAMDVAVDSQDNFIVTGYSDIINPAGFYHTHYLTIKYYDNGAEMWRKTTNDPSFDELTSKGMGVAVDPYNDDIYVAAQSVLSGGKTTDYLTIKYNPSGNELWKIRKDTGNYDEVTDIAVR